MGRTLNTMHNREVAGKAIKKIVCIALVVITLIPFYISFIYSIKYKNEHK